MNRTIGGLLTAGGIIGIIFFGYQYSRDTDSFQAFGADIAVSTGNYWPIIISAFVFLAGLAVINMKKRR